MSAAGTIVPRLYSNFRGVDFRGEEINLSRSPDSVNMWKDYRETDSIRTRPALEMDVSFSGPVYGIFFYGNIMVVHAGKNLYRVTQGGQKLIIWNNLNEAPSSGFVYKDLFYFKDGKHYLQYDGNTLKEVEGYVPTTSIARKPNKDTKQPSGGTIHEDVNLLTGRRINTFLADGENNVFWLDAKNIDTDFEVIVKVNDVVVPLYYYEGDVQKINYWVFHENGQVIFPNPPAAPLTDGRDNVSIEFSKTISKNRSIIENCTMLQVFDNRVFFAGNPDYPNVVWHCSLDDPTYCSDLDYYREGMDTAKVTGMVAGNNALWVFREPSDANTTVFYHAPTIDGEYGKIYPSQHSSVTTGCIGKAINFNDDIVFFSERGMEGISGDITTEQVVAHRSTMVDRKLISEKDYKNMVLEEWEGYLCVFIGDKVYLADSRAMFTNENHVEYEWFYWDLQKKVNCAKVHDGVLYIGCEDSIYTLTDNESAVESYWTTPKDKFKNPQKLKTTNKRGCTVEATGDISLYAKLEDTDFELIGKYEKVTDYFVSRIKRKKFKDIQLKFHSQTRFSLETATLECFIGGYIKR